VEGQETERYSVADTPLEITGSSAISIPQLIRLAREGSIRIPHFQRPFVWDAADVRQLFDSIYRGFPIGTVILWSREAEADEINFGPIHFEAPADSNALWVVDGQQRIISLFGALTPEWAGIDPRFDVYFDLSTRRFINARRGLVPPRAIPVREALETRRLAGWTRLHTGDLELDDFAVAESLVGVLRDYRISTYVVARDDEQTLREVFDRVNSSGKPITRAQVFQALFASDTQPGSPAVVVKEISRLGFGNLEENRVVQSLLAIRGGNVQRDLHEEFSEDEDLADWYDRTEEALTRAINFIRSQGVQHISLMPNTFPLPVLAAFFYIHPEPVPWVLRLLSRWLWRTWANGDSSQTPALRKAVNAINPKKLDLNEAPSEYDAVRNLLDYVSDSSVTSINLNHFRADKAQGRFILLALASLKPLRPDGTTVDLASEIEKYSLSAFKDLVRGHRSNAAARAFWPSDVQPFTGHEDFPVLASHVIDATAASMYRARDYEGFLRRRAELLEPFVIDFLNSHIETGSLIRPPLEELIIVEDVE
jgi:Protein of unknown function DUF262